MTRHVILAVIGTVVLALLPAASVAQEGRFEASPSAGTLLIYHGTEAKASLPLRANRLPGAPREFRTFVKHRLHQLWNELGHTAGCKSSPLLTVEALRTDGFAMGGVNTRPRRDCQTGGGYEAFWAVRHGAWKEVIGTQEVVDCSRLEQLGIPSEIGVHECYQDGQVVPYDHP
jgi:hypothetical protein